ncbi:MAG: GtrA family protein [Actinomycetia bacterium]|nr:GtrA family protein [Actinomycetes bacterium]
MTDDTRPSLRQRHGRTLRQFIKFGLVGGSGVLVNMVVAIIMNKLNGGDEFAQDILFAIPGTAYNFRFTSLVWIGAFLVANLWNFQLNRSWTFRSSAHATWFSEFWPFLAVGSAAAAAGLFIKVAMTNPTSPLFLPEPYFHGGGGAGLQSREYWAQLITIVVTTPINFVVNKLWTFRSVRSHRMTSGSGEQGSHHEG